MIDVLLPYYGDASLMRKAIESVLRQTSDQWNLLVVDDRSPNGAAARAWLDELEHERITVHRNDRNLGVNGNFRRCLELATAPHVVFMGCDDILLSNYVELMHEAFGRHPHAAFIQPRVRVIDFMGNAAAPLADTIKSLLSPSRGTEHILAGEELAVSLLRGAWTYFPAICWRRDALDGHGFRPALDTALDLALLLDLILEGEIFVLLDTVAFEYRRHRGSVSSRTAYNARRFEEERAVFRQVIPRLRELQWHRAERAARVHLTSRLHALSLMPAVASQGNPHALRAFARHALVP